MLTLLQYTNLYLTENRIEVAFFISTSPDVTDTVDGVEKGKTPKEEMSVKINSWECIE